MADTLTLSVVLGASLNKNFGGMFGKASARVGELGKALKQTHTQVGKIRNYQRLDAELGQTRVKLGETQRQALSLRQQMAAGGSTTKLANQLKKTTAQAERLGRTIEAQRSELRRDGQALRSAGIDTNHLNSANERLTRTMERQKSVLGAYYGKLGQYKRLRGELMGNVGKLTAGVAGAAIAAVPFVRWTGQAAKFDAEMLNIGNTADLTAKQVGKLRTSIFDGSRDTGQSVENIQKGIGILVAAGLATNTARASINSIGRTATAEDAQIEDLSNATVALINNLKIKPTGLQTALDILTQSGKEGNVELKDMAHYLPVLSSSFSSKLLMQGPEAVASMGAALEVARKGAGDANAAATNLNNYLQKVLSPTTLKAAKKNFGIDLYKIIKDAQKNGGNPFEASLKAIMKATGGDAKKLGEMFQDMQVQGFLAPMMQHWKEYERIKDRALNSHGVVDKDLERVNKSTLQRLVRIGQAWGRFKLNVGKGLGEAFVQLGAVITPVLNGLGKLAAAHPKLIGYVGMLTAGIVGLRLAMMGAKVASGVMKLGLLSTQIGAIAAGGAAEGAAGKIGLVTRAWRILNLSFIASPIGLIITGIGIALVGVALVVRKYWQPISAFMAGVWQGIKDAAGPVLKSIGAALRPLKPAWDAIIGALKTAWHWFGNLLTPVHEGKKELAGVTDTGRTVGRVLVAVFKGITLPLRIGIDLVGLLGRAIGSTAGVIADLWTGLKVKIDGIINWITGKIDWVINKWNGVKNTVGGLWHKIAGGGRTVAASALLGTTFMTPAMAATPGNQPAHRAAQVIQRAAEGARQSQVIDRSTHTTEAPITIHAAPGMDEKALAREVRKQLDDRDRAREARRRSALRDDD